MNKLLKQDMPFFTEKNKGKVDIDLSTAENRREVWNQAKKPIDRQRILKKYYDYIFDFFGAKYDPNKTPLEQNLKADRGACVFFKVAGLRGYSCDEVADMLGVSTDKISYLYGRIDEINELDENFKSIVDGIIDDLLLV